MLRRTIPVLACALAGLVVAPTTHAAIPHATSAAVTVVQSQDTHMFTFRDPRINEASGIETSVLHPHTVYTHNDSGDTARFFAVGSHGRTRAVFNLAGVRALDWEDIEGGPHKTLWLADVGDNAKRRTSVQLYKVKEPKRLVSRNVAWTRYDFVYGDGRSHNCEALMINPTTGRVYLITKDSPNGEIFRAPATLSTTRANVLTKVGTAPPIVTAADWGPSGRRFVLRTYTDAYFYHSIGGDATKMPLPDSGEAIAFSRTGRGVIVASEGARTPVYKVVRQYR